MTEHLGKLFSNPHSIPLPLWGKQFHFIACFTIHQHVRPKNTCFRAEKNMTALKMILFQWLHWVIITYLRLKRPKKVLQGRSPCCIPLYPSPLLMKNSSQLHLHSGKKLMAFGYKWTGKKAFLFSFFYFFWWVWVGISVHQLQKWFEAFFKSPPSSSLGRSLLLILKIVLNRAENVRKGFNQSWMVDIWLWQRRGGEKMPHFNQWRG